jgi:hypothetical protein
VKRNLLAASIVSCVLAGVGVTSAVAAPPVNGIHLTQSEVKKLAREARTPEQYTTLAGYYDQQQREYSQRAAEEKAEWVRRSQFTASIEAKYPRPVDSARYRYEYFTGKASEAAALSARYTQLLASAAQ